MRQPNGSPPRRDSSGAFVRMEKWERHVTNELARDGITVAASCTQYCRRKNAH